MNNNLKNENGFSLTEALISSALLGAVFLSVFLGVEKINTHQRTSTQLQSIELIKNSLYSILNNPVAWENTVNDPLNSVFSCTINSCKGVSGTIKRVRTSNNSIYFEDTGNNGFSANGKSCVSTRSNPDPNCFISAKLKVSFLCDEDCKSPLAKVEGLFYTLNETSVNLGNSFNFQLIKAMNTDPCGLGCKTVTFDPALAIKNEASLETSELKIIMVVDNSSSMKAAQEYLNTGLKSLFAKLKSLNIKSKIYIYTTTQLGESDMFPAATPNTYYRWEDKYGVIKESTEEPYKAAILDYEYTSRPLLLPPAGGDELTLTEDMSPSDYDEVISQLDKILTSSDEGIGTNGSSDEQGLCTVAKTLFDKGPNAIFNAGDKTLFLIVSDENDISEDACFAQTTESRDCDDKYGGMYSLYGCHHQPGPQRAETCDHVEYKIYEDDSTHFTANRQIHYQCTKTVVKDGVEVIDDDYKDRTGRKYVGRCADEPYRCIEADITQIKEVKNDCSGENDAITSCKISCWEYNRKPMVYLDTNKATMAYDLTKTSFTDGSGTSYSNLFEYMETKYPGRTFLRDKYSDYGEKWKPYCKTQPEKTVSYQELSGLNPDETTLKETIKMRADELFGTDGYSMSLIINDPTLNAQAGCSLQGDQSYGTEYKNFADNLEIKGAVSSICSKDYSNALENVSQFARKVANEAKKTIVMEEGEMLLKITTKDINGNDITLSTPDHYTVNGLVITFKNSFISESTHPVDVHIAKVPPNLKIQKPSWMKTAQSPHED
ncbi:MAG: hypothetical protein MK008_05075 [Bdellovibrionales bacterium]|nr:hypothetical protein [Bdellovibrionales bacterium]